MAYKLTYFNIMGLAEPIRFLFHYGNIDFIDNRLNKEKDWPKFKETTPYGQVPLLEFDGKVINQSRAICRFLASKVDLDGKNDIENLEIDSVVDTIYDLRLKIREVFHEMNQEVKNEKRKVLHSTHIPFYISLLDKLAAENNGHLALNRLTWADLFFADVKIYFSHCAEYDILQNAPNLIKVVENVEKIENIKKWIEKRPKTSF